jgi:hypothetical protein
MKVTASWWWILSGLVILSLTETFPAVQGLGSDYIDVAPMTVYESDEASPQTLDYDKERRVFPAIAGWYNDYLIHYYKFRIYAPPTYPNVISSSSTSMDVPVQKLYVTTTDGTMDGAVGDPILQYHHVDGVNYSDFMEVYLVSVASNYSANTYKSEGDVLENAMATPVPTGVILNLPIVPINATLQDPANSELAAPIDPIVAWYKGVPIWTYLFEVTNATAASYWADTRTADPSDPDFAVTVTPYASASGVQSIPLYFLNQYTAGVDGTNFGGPDSHGMRNILNLNRGDAGYSPLWQLLWVSQLPVNYSVNQVSNVADLTPSNGFAITPTPIFVNCPTVGAVASSVNPNKKSAFATTIGLKDASTEEMFSILGTDAQLILTPDVPVDLRVANTSTTVASTTTNAAGAYQFDLPSSSIPEGASAIDVVLNGTILRTIPVVGAGSGEGSTAGTVDTSTAAEAAWTGWVVGSFGIMALWL